MAVDCIECMEFSAAGLNESMECVATVSSAISLKRIADALDAQNEIAKLRACIERIDSINDNPAIFNKEINEAITNAIAGRGQTGFRSILSWEKTP